MRTKGGNTSTATRPVLGQATIFLVSYCLVAEREAKETKKFHERERKFQCWTGEWVARTQPCDDFLGCKHRNEGLGSLSQWPRQEAGALIPPRVADEAVTE